MAKFSESITKFMNSRNLLIFAVILILLLGIYYYSKTKMPGNDGMSVGRYSPASTVTSSPMTYAGPVQQMQTNNMEYESHPIANPSDLLPQDHNSQWTTLNPALSNNNVIVPDLLEAGYHIGLDTIGQTLRNANLQERSDPVIPKQEIGPWNNSTIEPDLARVPLEVGYGCR